MKILVMLLCITCVGQQILSQEISDDGRYFFCYDKIISTFDFWEKEIIPDIRNTSFFKDEIFTFQKQDTLYILKAGTSEISKIPNVKQIQKVAFNGLEYVVYLSSLDDKKLHVRSIQSERELFTASDVVDFKISTIGNTLLFKQSDENKTSIHCLFLSDPVWISQFITSKMLGLGAFVFDKAGKQLAFPNVGPNAAGEIWYFRKGIDSAQLLVSDATKEFPSGLKLCNDKAVFGFTPSGSNLYFLLENIPDTVKLKGDVPSVDVWSYNDVLIQAQQLTWSSSYGQVYRPHYLAAINLNQNESNPVLLQHRNQIRCGYFGSLPEINNNYVLILQPEGDLAYDYAGEQQGYLMIDYKWNKATKCNIFLVSLNTGQQILLKKGIKLRSFKQPLFKFSPDQKYVVFFDASEGQYFSYEISTGMFRNISNVASTSWIAGNPTELSRYYFDIKNRNELCWIGGSQLLVTDHFGDCWKLDLSGKSSPVMLTNYLGKKQHIEFSCVSRLMDNMSFKIDNKTIFFLAKRGLESGFYSIDASSAGKLNKIVWGKLGFSKLIKATSANIFLLQFENAKSKGWYLSNPQLSTLREIDCPGLGIPIKKDLIHWKTSDGKRATGLLYKPENFDSTKRYPVILTYYEKEASRNANIYEEYDEKATSGVGSAEPPIQYCLNQGYIVFIIDIDYKIGSAGASVVDYIVSGVKYLGNKRFVNPTKIGIIGHSFGGWETNYLITHANLFAAAVSGSGHSDLIAHYGNINNDKQGYPFTENQVRIGVTPWDRPDLFIKNSPIFYADRVTTPVLFMANKNDLRVPYSQSIAFFKALRVQGKRCWLLQYDNAEHVLMKEEDVTDFGIRQMQFFDHYLKGAPAPIWMTRGIPASQKGKKLGYEYDSVIKTPGPGLYMENPDAYTPEEKQLLKHKTTINYEGRIVNVIEMRQRNKNTNNK